MSREEEAVCAWRTLVSAGVPANRPLPPNVAIGMWQGEVSMKSSLEDEPAYRISLSSPTFITAVRYPIPSLHHQLTMSVDLLPLLAEPYLASLWADDFARYREE